jgi:hypothetical protein
VSATALVSTKTSAHALFPRLATARRASAPKLSASWSDRYGKGWRKIRLRFDTGFSPAWTAATLRLRDLQSLPGITKPLDQARSCPVHLSRDQTSLRSIPPAGSPEIERNSRSQFDQHPRLIGREIPLRGRFHSTKELALETARDPARPLPLPAGTHVQWRYGRVAVDRGHGRVDRTLTPFMRRL